MGKFADALDKAGYSEPGGKPGQEEHAAPLQPGPAQPEHPGPQFRAADPKSGNSGKWDERLFQAVHHDQHLPELFKVLRSRILHPADGKPVPKTIMVTSAIPREGKSFVAANLAITIAQALDQHALLVDCDLRRPTLAKMFGLKRNPGLVNYLRDKSDLASLIAKTSIDKLSLLPSGDPPVNPAELLASTLMNKLVQELSSRYEDRFIIFDTPPFHAASEAGVLSHRVDGVIIVVRAGGAGKPQIQMVADAIGRERIIGVVFNAYTSNIIERSLMKGYGYYQEAY